MKGCQVELRDISKAFGDYRVLKNISLTIRSGEFFSLLGPSGCGKTTLLRLIAGFEDPGSGDITLDGASVLSLPSNKRHVNTVFQNYALFPHLSVFENVAFPLRLRKMDAKAVTAKVEQYLALVRLEAHRDRFPAQLSGGQKQRVAIARALINEPGVLLLDEPLAALDAKLRQHMLLELDAIHDEIGITFIYVTHDQQEAISVSDRVAVMNEGAVLQVASPIEIYERPADEFVARFIGESNILEGVAGNVADGRCDLSLTGGGAVLVGSDKPVRPGDRLVLTVRPEKITLAADPAALAGEEMNCLPGVVEEIIYTGFLSKYFIRCGETTLRVFGRHRDLTFGDKVFAGWRRSDGYVVEVRTR